MLYGNINASIYGCIRRRGSVKEHFVHKGMQRVLVNIIYIYMTHSVGKLSLIHLYIHSL